MILSPNLNQFLSSVPSLGSYIATPLIADASFRRYFRIQSGNLSYVLMDASLEKKSCQPYCLISNALRKNGLVAPEIFASDFSKGYLLLTDFGNKIFLREVNSRNARALYHNALEALQLIRQCNPIYDYKLPLFDANFILQELQLFKEWFLEKFLKLIFTHHENGILSDAFEALAQEAMLQPQVFMHRDYHSANLMILENNQMGILDFQDAFLGPLTYDLVSLLRDCYVAWPDDFVTDLALQYREKISFSIPEDVFLRWFDWMGLQRHMKALLTFSRKFLRDQNRNYLQHMPRTLKYIRTVASKYSEFHAFHELMCSTIYPAYERNEEKVLCVE